MKEQVTVKEERLIIPTYLTSAPDKNPLFFEKRVYQGSSGKVYPLPITEKILDEKTDVEYPALILENEYLQVTILPTLGGRIQRALDKTNNYDFVYYNHVIKPALVGLVGPWISGGIEFNWPQHHRPTTFMPTEYQVVENSDGSKTVWVSEIDQMYGTKGMAGFTLYPDKAYIEITGKVYNRTDVPQTFLWWANPAVPANDHTLSVFPPDVHAVMDHGKRAVSDFPIATGTYYKYDYSAGVDISKYKNIKVPTSYMAHHSDFDFVGNYDEKLESGLLHVADHHISPGKKQWVWGNSDFGLAWDRNLTDEDGPYVELMTGVFTDNQPDFTWLKPYEEKEFKQYFMPYKGVGRVKNATINGAVNVEIVEGQLFCRIYTTQNQSQVTVKIYQDQQVIFEEQVNLSPVDYYQTQLAVEAEAFDERFRIEVLDEAGQEIVAYQGLPAKEEKLPEPAEALAKPADIKSTEELFLAAVHIEQYRHATSDAESYYLEGLRRDASDIRLNNGYGMFLYKRGQFAESLTYFERAVKKQKWKSPNPYYGEPLFNLGLAQLQLGEYAAAYDSFYKATWSDDTQGAAFFQLACLALGKGQTAEALTFVERALVRNQYNMKARLLKTAILRKTGQTTEDWLVESLKLDPLDLGSYYEKGAATQWEKVMRGSLNNYLELALDYYHFGLLEDSLKILQACPQESPLVYYYQADIYRQLGASEKAKTLVAKAEKASPDYCFPNKLREIHILQAAINLLPEKTGYAKYYLGNLFYDKRRYDEAIVLWEDSAKQIPDFPTVYRNLSFAYYNQLDDLARAQELIIKAFELNPADGRVLMERDLLAQKAGTSLKERVAVLETYMATTQERDDLFIVYIGLLNSQGRYQEAFDLMMQRQFHPWEGGEGKASAQYMFSLIELAKMNLTSQPQKAIEALLASQSYPDNLGEGKLPNVEDNISNYYIAKAYKALGDAAQAAVYYELASRGSNQPESVLYYYDQPADTILYRGLAHEALGQAEAARSCYYQLISYGKKHLFDEVEYDFFAVSMPETVVFKNDLTQNNSIYCSYLIALGHIGLKEMTVAKKLLTEILVKVPDHQGALRHLAFIK
ncbi:tetratricopeptide (TPR) repeat protein [Enterococcus sp. PF1-24]|uniref:DUF5107 domain-containing protein n=1 Tax=unclassified Enterococcus TaxID=2608891 RepID=UPI002474780D|nr:MULTISPECIES: DUF5107 domain-containing protein [unclassified Enterococcus]MDH6364284.1 tetratricopeptide (TPR) repeat protein [Enterococcus sp. PFB1-1]MDH6401357.1 tetratricopeptide (TPR) repeat protein [Enterococcus sp. PF1-24]